ncbi:SAM-dependent DNA methyltransferase [Ectothiorhodospiraceae bacterium BW-2]|nr:SAM-dependent DNA methyltransferase [Ectothiorhodospiraceae bacterium BW-2]
MQPLDKTLRNRLEATIKSARELAENAARAALQQLGVGETAPFSHLSETDRELRRRLRVHGRQLGDQRQPNGEQEISRLIEETAYEHWHRMLFARFLAENNLLMYPDPDDPVAVTLEECDDLAADEGAANGWELAARFAARMLPQIFRLDSPVFQLSLPPEHQQKLERLVADLPPEVFTASDSLGWVYQFWQAKKKDEVNAAEVKIGARELPAVTQLFTEPYMVSFLLDNSLGAWWVRQWAVGSEQLSVKARELLQSAANEDELRSFFSRSGIPFAYLRFVKTDHCTLTTDNSSVFTGEHWMPAAGWFEGWPDNLSELKTLDPCCGSGHFLVAALLMLVPMRMELEGLSAQQAVDAVLRENIHGLELDQRCVELAAFALALTAWKYPSAGGYRVLPELNVACSGLSVSVAKEEWKQLGLGKRNLTIALDWMHDTFKDAPVLGSLLDPKKQGLGEHYVQWDELSSALEQALKIPSPQPLSQKERSFSPPSPSGRGTEGEGYEQQEVAVVAQGLAKAATLLAGRYQWVITNVPYLARGKQNERLRDFCEKHYSEAKNDLATVFLDRCLELCVESGTSSIVLPQNWLFLTSYKKFREKLLNNDTWHLIARLGPGAFETISGEVVKAILITLSRGNSSLTPNPSPKGRGEHSLPLPLGEGWGEGNNLIRGVDVSEPRTAAEKAAQLLTGEIKSVEQAKQLENPDARVGFEKFESVPLLAEIADYGKGSTTGDGPRFLAFFWEFSEIQRSHRYWLNSPNSRDLWTGRSQLCKVPLNDVELNEQLGCRLHGQNVFGRPGVVVNKMRKLEPFLYFGEAFDDNICPICPTTEDNIPAIWSYVDSSEFHDAVRAVDQALKVTAATITKVPFDVNRWAKVAEETYSNGLPKPYTDDPTQWIFHGHPCGSVIWDEEKKWTIHGTLRTDDTVLQVAVARLLGYRWPAETSPLNPLSINGEGTSPDSPSPFMVRGTGGEVMELADEQREWVKRCETLSLTPALSQGERGHSLVDDDGIVCIPPVRGEAAASDRLLNLLAAAFNQNGGDAWSNDTLAQLLKSADHAGKTLETWLREKFFTQHCKLFQNRPFIWHIWDGLRDGFAALVNYHKFDAKLLETLIYTYLGDWISRQKQDITSGIDGAEEKLAAAEALKKKLELILEGEAPYDIFVRWKPLEQQPIGWDPDLNDGVRLNIRPFLSVPDVGKKGAGVLRDKPDIKWTKDRGKDVESAPWYHRFNGDRINDHHLTLAEKRAARENKGAD